MIQTSFHVFLGCISAPPKKCAIVSSIDPSLMLTLITLFVLFFIFIASTGCPSSFFIPKYVALIKSLLTITFSVDSFLDFDSLLEVSSVSTQPASVPASNITQNIINIFFFILHLPFTI